MRPTLRIAPLWRRAPLRVLRTGVAGLLLVLAIAAPAAAAASAPLFAESAGNHALHSVLAAVPETALARDAAVVRVVGGETLRSEDQRLYVDQMRAIPGVGDPVVTGVSVSPETQIGRYPVVRANGVAVPARLASVPDPHAALVPTGLASGDVWLPDPLARLLEVGPGDTIEFDMTGSAPPVIPVGGRGPSPVQVTIAGTYAVAADGRRPADPPGTTAWSARRGDLPPDIEIGSRTAWFVVGDAPTIERMADTTGDQLLWAVEAQLDPTISLAEADRTAAGVAELRRNTLAPQGGSEGALRIGVVSGVEQLVAQADELAAASTVRGRLWTGAGVAAGLAAVLAVALLGTLDRRRELAHGAATGVGPGRTLGLWALETVLPALVGAAVGIGGAALVRQLTDSGGSHASDVWIHAVTAGLVVSGVAVAIVALVGLVGNVLVQRPEDARSRRRAPWIWVLAVATGVAVLAALTGPSGAPGPVEVATPVLLAATAGTLVAVVLGWLARRAPWTGRLPSGSRSGRWLAWRRLAALGPAQVMVVCAVTVGLSVAMFAASAAQATDVVVADRAAVASGAHSTARIEGSWLLDPTAPQAPTATEIEDGVKVPEGHTPPVPDDQVVVWRSSVAVSGLFGYRDLLVADPTRLADVASWGRGSDLADVRSAVRSLDRSPVDGEPVPVVVVGDPTLHVGDDILVSGQEWQVPARVTASVASFPGKGETPMLVASEDAWLPELGWFDPRLVPPSSSIPPRPYVETSVWSAGSMDALETSLQEHDVKPTATSTSDLAEQTPVLVAARYTKGYQVALAVFLVLTAAVAAGLYAARTAHRQRAADLVLARVGMTGAGVRRARTWELVSLTLLAAVGAVLTMLVLRPLGTLLVDLDPGELPALEVSVGAPAWVALGLSALVVLAGGLGVSWYDARASRRPGSALGEEAVLRAAD